MQGVQVRSLVRGLRSHMPCGQKDQIRNRKQYGNAFNKAFKNGPHPQILKEWITLRLLFYSLASVTISVNSTVTIPFLVILLRCRWFITLKLLPVLPKPPSLLFWAEKSPGWCTWSYLFSSQVVSDSADLMNYSTPGASVLQYLRVCSNPCPLSQWCYLTV